MSRPIYDSMTTISGTVNTLSVLRKIRHERNISAAEIGKAIGISDRHVRRIESGDSTMPLDYMDGWLSVLGISGIELSLRVAVHRYKITGTIDDQDAVIEAALRVLPDDMKAHISELIMWALAKVY
nr:helix-turn-helix transcriptional regulator [Plesiomonas shigelloides]